MKDSSDIAENKITSLAHFLDMFSFMNYQSVYIYDYYNKKFLFVSDNPLFLCGLSVEMVMNLNYKFYEEHIPENELKKIIEINHSSFKFIDSIQGLNEFKFRISYDFHLLNSGKNTLINHCMIPIVLTESEKIMMCSVSLSSHKTFGHAAIYMDKSPYYWEYFMESHKWKKKQSVFLSEVEKEILYMVSGGFTISEMADKIYKSIDTIKFYRHNILEKLNVSNMNEALTYAVNYKLL
ncbi:response regulator transcription factor [Phocaeicola vulgatus]|jgi:DNA-binding CsgD family transcriptional regulator|uniref:response regulator transcription factor n=1 Tax=Phocaeicola vulgatus TaxID=821 RepID=UPI0021661F04|nr:helix-turn-helix transcriptional regulator [Phocaeicola vulgatus]MCS2749128.1 helix-turn-helix transcriptional regulator [Phocaeicola vulgatus]